VVVRFHPMRLNACLFVYSITASTNTNLSRSSEFCRAHNCSGLYGSGIFRQNRIYRHLNVATIFIDIFQRHPFPSKFATKFCRQPNVSILSEDGNIRDFPLFVELCSSHLAYISILLCSVPIGGFHYVFSPNRSIV
jgi:hypothetical protein